MPAESMTKLAAPITVPPQQSSATHYTFTSESVSEGHPDKVCDYVADSILDAHLALDPQSRVACEVLAKARHLVLAGEITSSAEVDLTTVAREAVAAIGYTDRTQAFNADDVEINVLVSAQASEIAHGVAGESSDGAEQGAGDQGIMFGYAKIGRAHV